MAGDSDDKAADKGAATRSAPAEEAATLPVAYLRESSEQLFGVGRDVLDGALVDAGLAHRANLTREQANAAIKAHHSREVVPGTEA